MVASASRQSWVEATLGEDGANREQSDELLAERGLIARLQRREAGAFDELVRRHQDRVFDFCARLMGDREEALDLTQDIFVSVHQHVARFRSDARLSTWLFRVSKNHCLNRLKYLQRRGRGRADPGEEMTEELLQRASDGPLQPDAALDAARERRMVQAAIARLEPEQRLLVALRDIEGLSYEEIIEITELPEGTVKSRLHRARERLAEIIERLDPGAEGRGD